MNSEEKSFKRRGTRQEQILTANRVYGGLLQKNTVALLVAECQSGKTGVAIELNNLFGADEMYGGCLILQPSDNELGEQNKLRFEKAEFDKYCGGHENEKNLEKMCKGDGGAFYGILTPSSMTTPKSTTTRGGRKSLESKKVIDRVKTDINDGKTVFIIHDEGHANSTKLGKLNKFSEDMGLGLFGTGNIPPNVKILKLTATPGADITDLLNNYKNNGRLSLHFLNSTEDYYGLAKANKDGRLHETWKLGTFDDKKSNDNKSKRGFVKIKINEIDGRQKFCDEIITPNIKLEKNGYIIVRCTSVEGAKDLKSYISSSFKDKNIECSIYSSTPQFGTECINDFSKFFVKPKQEDIDAGEIDQSSIEPDRIKILIIIQSYRQGKTFDVNKFVLAWFDTNAGNDAANIQSIGRNFGYGKYGTYPIYTSLESVNGALELYQTAKDGKVNISAISSTTAVAKSGRKFKYGEFEIESFDSEEGAKEAAEAYHLKRTGCQVIDGYGRKCEITIARVKDNSSTNIAESCRNGKYSKDISHHGHRKDEEYLFGIIDLREGHKDYMEDWINLPEDIRGKFLYWRKEKTKIETEKTKEFDTKSSAYQDETINL